MKVGDKITYIGTHDEDILDLYGTDLIDINDFDVYILRFNLTHNKTYTVIENDDDIFEYEEKIFYDMNVSVRNDKGLNAYYEKKYFLTEKELRKEKLQRLNS